VILINSYFRLARQDQNVYSDVIEGFVEDALKDYIYIFILRAIHVAPQSVSSGDPSVTTKLFEIIITKLAAVTSRVLRVFARYRNSAVIDGS
jgi:hypothetical protein